MQINSVNCYNSSNRSFGGKLVSNYALRKFTANLSDVELGIFEKLIKDIEKVDDGKKFIYEPMYVGNNRILKIHEIDKNGKSIEPPIFVRDKGKPIDIFRQVADWYKHKYNV